MTEKWVKITLGCLALSMLLQLVALVSPGWIITETSGSTTTYIGIFYLVVCGDITCLSQSIPETWINLNVTGAQLGSVIFFWVCSIIAVTVAGAFTTLVAGIKVSLVVQGRTWLQPYTSVSLFCLGIANTLQWACIALYINSNVVTAYMAYWLIFPWCLFLYGLSALLVSGVILAQGIIFMKTQFRPMLNGLHKPRPAATNGELKDINSILDILHKA